MKRVYLILTLFIASFFFVSLNKVSAATYTYEISESNFDYINDEFFKLREKTIEYCEANNLSYIIGYNISYGKLLSHVFNFTTYNFLNQYDMPRIEFGISANMYYIDNDTLKSYGTLGSYYTSFYNKKDVSTFSYLSFLDTNIESINNTSPYFTWDFKYQDLTYTLNSGTKIPTLYEIYLDVKGDEPVVSDKFIEEKELMNNFYSTIFTKISDLATSLANNYTFLTIFGIFILIFVLELIRRYLL